MKHQQIQLASKRNFIRLMALVAMLALMVCCAVLWVNAAGDEIEFNLTNAGYKVNSDGYWEKEYDGDEKTIAADLISVTVNGVPVTVNSAQLDNANAGTVVDGKYTLSFVTVNYGDNQTANIPVRITPRVLSWNGKGTAEVDCNASGQYTNVAVTVPTDALDTTRVLGGKTVAITAAKVSFTYVGYGSTTTVANVTLDDSNYTVDSLPVDITINPVAINAVKWEGLKDSFVYGDADLFNIKAIGNDDIPMNVMIKVGEEFVTLAEAYGTNGLAVGDYELTAVPVGTYCVLADGVNAGNTISVTKATYNVVLNSGEFVDEGDLVNPNASFGYALAVTGKDGATIPEWILSAITYKYTDASGKTVAKVTKPGVYTVKATIPAFDNVDVKIDNDTATLTVLCSYKVALTPDGAIVIVNKDGISNSVEVLVTVPESIARPALRGLDAYKAYTLTINGAGDQVFNVRIPVSQELIGENLLALTAADLYIYDSNAGTKEAANGKYTVSLSEDGSYYIIEGYASAGDITFMIAPEYDTPFWSSAIGIALIVLLVLILVIAVPLFIGLMLIRIERSGRNPVISVETQGNLPEFEPVVVPDLIEDPDAIIEEGLEDKVDALAAEIEAETDEIDVDATDAVADAMALLDEELAEIDLAAYEAADIADAEAAAAELADQLVRDLMDDVSVPEDTADVSDEVQKAVADAMAENFNESADATDAIALITDEEVVEEEAAPEVVEEAPVEEAPVEETPVEEAPVEEPAPAAEESEDDEDESFGGFGSMPLDYIDAIVEAERYAEMLEQERRGEVQLVTRYRRSYLSRLAQSQGSIQDYYNAIKNLLLSYKGVKNRISWNFESFNVGRTPLAKFNAKTRTLYVYIAFSPEELVDTKYNFTDMSEKKKYAAVPVLFKVKGERKFKHALELITKLCEEKLQLPKKKNFAEADYRMPFKTTEELVNEGIVKMMVAAIPVSAPVEDTTEEVAPVEEVVAEEVVAEEVVAEEAVVEEAVAEEAVAEEAVAEEATEEGNENA